MADRYSPYRYPQYPQNLDMVDVPYISYQSEEFLPMVAQGMENMQKRWDTAQAAMAKYLEDAGAAEMRDKDKDAVMNWIAEDLERIKGDVEKRYSGDYGRAVNDIVQSLAKSSRVYKTAAQMYKEEQPYKAMRQKLITEGKLVTPKGVPDPFKTQAFDERTGTFTPLDYSQMYERNDYNKWIGENISKRLNENITNTVRSALADAKSGANPYIVYDKIKGMTNEQIIKDKDRIISDADAEMFLKQNPTYAMEFSNTLDETKKYMLETTLNQVSRQIDTDLTKNAFWEQNQDINKNRKKILSDAPFSMPVEKNPYVEERNSTYSELFDEKMPRFLRDRQYNNVSDLRSLYRDRLEKVAGKVVAGIKSGELTATGELKDGIDQALETGQLSLLAPMLGKVLGSPAIGMGIILKGDTRPLTQEDINVLHEKLKELDSIEQDIKNARENLKNRKIENVDKLSDRQIAAFLDQDYTLRSLRQDQAFGATIYGSEVLTKAFNDNILRKTSGGFRIAGEAPSTDIDIIAKSLNRSQEEVLKEISDSKQWNYNFSTGEFSMSVGNNKRKEPKSKTIHFNLDDVTRKISDGLKIVEEIESNKNKSIKEDDPPILDITNTVNLQYSGKDKNGTRLYSMAVIGPSGRVETIEDVPAYNVRLAMKQFVIEPYLSSTYGQ